MYHSLNKLLTPCILIVDLHITNDYFSMTLCEPSTQHETRAWMLAVKKYAWLHNCSCTAAWTSSVDVKCWPPSACLGGESHLVPSPGSIGDVPTLQTPTSAAINAMDCSLKGICIQQENACLHIVRNIRTTLQALNFEVLLSYLCSKGIIFK